jgi:hypothetical protein
MRLRATAVPAFQMNTWRRYVGAVRNGTMLPVQIRLARVVLGDEREEPGFVGRARGVDEVTPRPSTWLGPNRCSLARAGAACLRPDDARDLVRELLEFRIDVAQRYAVENVFVWRIGASDQLKLTSRKSERADEQGAGHQSVDHNKYPIDVPR